MKSSCCKICAVVLTVIVLISLLVTGFVQASSTHGSARIITNKLVEIETRQGVSQKFIFLKPENPVASVILLDGYGNYQMGTLFGKPAIGKGENGTLIRTREIFAKHGLMVAAVDKPSDQKPPPNPMIGIIPKFRVSDEHAQDIKAVLSYLKKEANIPVWLIGMCQGTFSAANGGVNIKEGIDGLIFLSPVTRPQGSRFARMFPNGIIDMDLNTITVPTLIVVNKDDECLGTPPSGANEIREALVNSPVVEVKYLTGGKVPVSGPCEGMSYHGFYGIEAQVVFTIADFITSNMK